MTSITSQVVDTYSPVSSVSTRNISRAYKKSILTAAGYSNIQDNTIIGNTGNNILDAGNGGVDLLTGQAGADVFRFSSRPSNFRGTDADHITDFSSVQGDKIQISKSAFGITAVTPSFSAVSDVAALTKALRGSSMFIYDSSSGELHWNQNGLSTGAGSGGIAMVLDNKPTLSPTDLTWI